MKLIAVTALITLFANASFAETVRDHYKTVIDQTPYSVEVCKDVRRNGASAADTLFGAIIGGTIGNQLGNGSGKDAMTVLGAIVGAEAVTNNSNKQAGVQRQCQTETRYEERRREVYSHSVVTFYADGKKYSLKFQKQ